MVQVSACEETLDSSLDITSVCAELQTLSPVVYTWCISLDDVRNARQPKLRRLDVPAFSASSLSSSLGQPQIESPTKIMP